MLEISAQATERRLEHEGMPVIWLTVTTPVFSGGKKRATERINAFYGHLSSAVEKSLKRHMLKQASADLDEAIAKSRPFEPYRVKLDFKAAQDGEALEINRRIYVRTRDGAERERMLTERWSTCLGLPELLMSKAVDYASSSDTIDIS